MLLSHWKTYTRMFMLVFECVRVCVCVYVRVLHAQAYQFVCRVNAVFFELPLRYVSERMSELVYLTYTALVFESTSDVML